MTNYEKAIKVRDCIERGRDISTDLEWEHFVFQSGNASAEALLYKNESGIWKQLDLGWISWSGFSKSNFAPHRAVQERIEILNSKQ